MCQKATRRTEDREWSGHIYPHPTPPLLRKDGPRQVRVSGVSQPFALILYEVQTPLAFFEGASPSSRLRWTGGRAECFWLLLGMLNKSQNFPHCYDCLAR